MLTFRELHSAFRQLGIDRDCPVIAHASLSAFGDIQGGADALLGAMLAAFDQVLMPAFTYKTMLVPELGPEGNGVEYGAGRDRNLMAEFYRPDMPVDRLMGAVPEALRRHDRAERSHHPILSFVGVNARPFLAAQTLEEPLAPVGRLAQQGGWVLLLGVNYTVNTSVHYAEKLAGRKQFVRWALSPSGVVECPGFPGCSDGFEALAPRMAPFTRKVKVGGAQGGAQIEAVPLIELVQTVREWIAEDPLALLCSRTYCDRCHAVRESVALDRAANS